MTDPILPALILHGGAGDAPPSPPGLPIALPSASGALAADWATPGSLSRPNLAEPLARGLLAPDVPGSFANVPGSFPASVPATVPGSFTEVPGSLPSESGPANVPESFRGLRTAALAAWSILLRGGSALDAVEAAVRLMEDDPEFNAGTGSCLTASGDVELDASIMDGATLRCGAVAAVRDVRNPVSLARLVMERTTHVLLVGPGASAFARNAGLPAHPNHLLITPRQRNRWEERHARGTEPAHLGTVGAVARDRHGHLAAATSTGGTAMKLPGRVGDSALIGAGTYADDLLGAVSCTGEGERMIQLALARQAAELTQRLGAQEAARHAIALLRERVAGRGGLIVLGPRGDPGFALNTASMARAYTRGGALVIESGP